MPPPTPRFWYRPRPGLRAWLLRPCGWLYGLAVHVHRLQSRPWQPPLPVVSVGNLTLGGTGKTPLVIALARELTLRGWRPAVLSRGYGSGRREPLRVEPQMAAAAVGDEPLELVRALPGVPVWIGSDRVASARRALEAGADLLLLDDGLQHWRLARDCDVSVLDGQRRLGNGLLFPAGPLREPPAALARADLLVLTGMEPEPGALAGLPWPAERPWFGIQGRLALPAGLRERPLLAFCGIGLPEKFFAALRQEGCRLVGCEAFPDHHPYARTDVERLLTLARAQQNATLVTTAKDWQRLVPLLEPRERDGVLPVPLALDPGGVARLTDAVLAVLARRGWGRHG
ncbi:tetraacyldisaccharide 4'-kinase [Cyanobium sp. CH-040]|uniref:tetraacyldisaccharide 4'-kinase n=1 Tax=Cyanobium sp. CH-040 TaxID=2823708 RepID=UPI0020CF7934|nr:tetraacyldisaccharide 4'-kinase [Cyanobium sp. CH-040]MCP9927405.1 tetraacyldisaccharide 4'-kinase [Cyanobium sp. CH-040]